MLRIFVLCQGILQTLFLGDKESELIFFVDEVQHCDGRGRWTFCVY
jgi:hypothetical protein